MAPISKEKTQKRKVLEPDFVRRIEIRLNKLMHSDLVGSKGYAVCLVLGQTFAVSSRCLRQW
jgi:hypothetical protein